MNIIVAVDAKFGIARDTTIPWFGTQMAKDDLEYFRYKTLGNRVVMGRATWDVLPRRPLPQRENVVLTREKIPVNDSVTTITSIDQARDGDWIIGGAATYAAALQTGRAATLYITLIDYDYGCDTHFPMRTLYAHYATNLLSSTKFRYTVKDNPVNVYRMIVQLTPPAPHPPPGEPGYLHLLREVIIHGEVRRTRNATTHSLFARTLTFDLKHFPLLTTKTVFFKGVIDELMMFIRGQTDTNVLSRAGIHIWEGNTSAEFLRSKGLDYPPGEMGPMYGYNWRHFGAPYTPLAAASAANASTTTTGCDQLQRVIRLIAENPTDRSIMMTTYNPAVADQGVLYPCHGISTQFYVSADGKLSCLMTQRSADAFLGVPFNIASYALLVHILCSHVNHTRGTQLTPGTLTITFGDVHIYQSHTEAVYTQLLRAPGHAPPRLRIVRGYDNIEDYSAADIEIMDYQHDDRIRADMVA